MEDAFGSSKGSTFSLTLTTSATAFPTCSWILKVATRLSVNSMLEVLVEKPDCETVKV